MASSLSTAAVRALTQSASPLAAACAPLLQRLSSLSGGAAAFSSSSSSCAPAAGGAASGGGGEPDAFTASLQHKTEEELRQLALKQGQPHTADAAEDSAAEGEQQEQVHCGGGTGSKPC